MTPFIHNYTVDIRSGMRCERAKLPVGHGDALADCFVVTMVDGHEAVDLTGVGVSALVVRPDGMTVPLEGEAKDGSACVTLDDMCYDIPGNITVTVILSAGEMKQSVLRVSMNVATGETDIIAETEVLNVADVLAAAERAEAAAERAEAAAGSGGGSGGVVDLNKEAITDALGYTPADEQDVQQIKDYVVITPGDDGEVAENVMDDPDITWQENLYVNFQTGATSTYDGRTGTEDYIPIPAGARLFARYTNAMLYYPTVAFYSSSKTFVGGEYPILSSTDERAEYNGMYGVFYTVPDTARYFRLSTSSTLTILEVYVITTAPVGGMVEIPALRGYKSLIDGKTVVCFGDSLFGMYRGDDSAPAFVAQETGATVHNVGFGGCRMATHYLDGYKAFSMWALAKAIAEDDWTDQDAQASSGSAYFPEQLELLKSIDFNNVDMAVIHYGTNDFAAASDSFQIDNEADPDDYTTLCGALRYSLDKLLGKYPQLRIFVSLPCFRFWPADDGTVTYSDTYTNAIGKTLPDFAEALRKVAMEYNLPVIDSYYGLGVNKINAATYLSDGTHHNATGRERFGRFIGAALASQAQSQGGSGGGGLPTGGAPHQQLVTDADGNALWEDRLAYAETVNAEVIPETEWVNNEGQFVLAEAPTNQPAIGVNHTVVYNGVSYDCVGVALEEDGKVSVGLGNTYALGLGDAPSEVPFVVVIIPLEEAAEMGMYGLCLPMDGAESVTMSIKINDEVVHPLDEKYIPDSVKAQELNLVNGNADGSVRGVNTASEDKYTMGENAFAGGYNSMASGYSSVAYGSSAKATGTGSAAIGSSTEASGEGSVAIGFYARATGQNAVALMGGLASGLKSFAHGEEVEAAGKYQTVFGRYNVKDADNRYVHIIGNGTGYDNSGYPDYSNAHTLDWDGNAWFAGYVEGTKLILPSPNGTRWAITVGDDGTLSAAAVTE